MSLLKEVPLVLFVFGIIFFSFQIWRMFKMSEIVNKHFVRLWLCKIVISCIIVFLFARYDNSNAYAISFSVFTTLALHLALFHRDVGDQFYNQEYRKYGKRFMIDLYIPRIKRFGMPQKKGWQFLITYIIELGFLWKVFLYTVLKNK